MALLALFLLAVLTIYGFVHEHLLSQPIWTPEGRVRLLGFSAAYWVIAGAFLIFAPRWLGPSAAVLAVGYAIWWVGPAAGLTPVYLFGSCFCLGRILRRDAEAATAILLGLAAWIFVIWLALHFAVNTRAVYAVALAIPYFWVGRAIGFSGLSSRAAIISADDKRRSAAPLAIAGVIYFLLLNLLVALKPEISADGLSMHLALPMAVAHDHFWNFDFRHTTWALMPAGGDCVFTAAYLLGGEFGAKLTNFGLLVLIAAMVRRFSQNWLTPLLFLSTPLVFLLTGSLFVENVWAALILGAVLAIVRYADQGEPRELYTAGALFGASLAVKTIAGVFLAPAAIFALIVALKRRQILTLAGGTVLLAAFAAPPYVYAWAKSGNPLFPFANTTFRSPYFSTTEPFVDPRFLTQISWTTGYDATFRSSRYIEGQGGAAGFQYFLLLIPAGILIRRRSTAIPFAVGTASIILLFTFLPNLRYTYPALPLLSIAIAEFLCIGQFACGAFFALAALNAWFLGSSGWYQKDFALFRKAQIPEYLEFAAPERILNAHLNRIRPGEPVAFFSSDAVAGLQAASYTDSWHTNEYWMKIRSAQTPADVAATFREYGIRTMVTPVSLEASKSIMETFLREWAEPLGITASRMGLFSLRAMPIPDPMKTVPLLPGTYDDADPHIEYTGSWIHVREFPGAANRSLTYCDETGASVRVNFVGSGITYVFTKALNRGTAQVMIDGAARANIDQYSADIQWQTERSFDRLKPGPHVLEIRVTRERNASSSGTFVDLDAIVVRK